LARKIERAIGYVRLSRLTEASTSVERQREAIEHTCKAQGWELVDVFEDVDVSATATGLDRPGLRRARAAIDEGRADVLVVWRLDRLARSVGDFSVIIGKPKKKPTDDGPDGWGLQVKCATQAIDTTDAYGRAMAQITQVFAELEASTIAARVRSSVDFLRRSGRRAGGQVPWGWRNVPNPDGPGLVLALDPDRAPFVREAVDRVIAGESVRSIARDWSTREPRVPVPQAFGRDGDKTAKNGGRRRAGEWDSSTLANLLRRPVLAGLTVHHGEILRGPDGLPRVDERAALITQEERRRLLEALDGRTVDRPQDKRANRALLHGLAVCDGCGSRLYPHRPSDPKRPARYTCQDTVCQREGRSVAVSLERLDSYVTAHFLAAWGRLPVLDVVEEAPTADAIELERVEEALRETSAALAVVEDDDTETELLSRLRTLRARARDLRNAPTEPQTRYVPTGHTFAGVWASAHENTDTRRELLRSALEEIVVRKGQRGRHGLDPERVRIVPRYRPDTSDMDGESSPANKAWLIERYGLDSGEGSAAPITPKDPGNRGKSAPRRRAGTRQPA
jgi:DNA invertase Pin-like site-specific DNA recombinase